jgi:hypothetical protein
LAHTMQETPWVVVQISKEQTPFLKSVNYINIP